jgi:hypothetical protein
MTKSQNRGRTSPGRLSAMDAFLVHTQRDLFLEQGLFEGSWVVDVGIGENPWTTLELARAIRAFAPTVRVVGVESDAVRLRRAQGMDEPGVEFASGSFESPLLPGRKARLVRAMNIVRGHSAEDVPALHRHLSRPLVLGGLLCEGSTDDHGHVLTAHLLRKTGQGLVHEGLWLHTDFERGFAPLLFRDFLPRDLRRSVRRGEPIHGLFEAWNQAWSEVRGEGADTPRAAFEASARRLPPEASLVDGLPGSLLWRPQRALGGPG